jgi:hypothetical protein
VKLNVFLALATLIRFVLSLLWFVNHNWAHLESFRFKVRQQANVYDKEAGPSDPMYLSFTHDQDHTKYTTTPVSLKGHHYHPWCPPRGKEHGGFYDNDDVKSQDEL